MASNTTKLQFDPSSGPIDFLLAPGATLRRESRTNPPALDTLRCNNGSFNEIAARLLDAAQQTTTLNTTATRDWSVALIYSWATVIQVLTFYLERIVNEGYIRTSKEARSIFELARTVAYDTSSSRSGCARP